jgi:AcrR family transcriptional regulator
VENKTIEPRKAVAARNVEAILDAAERLLDRGAPLNFSALAAEAGVSRPTVYAHFADRRQLLTALLERSVRQAVSAIESAGPDEGRPVEALRRLVRVGWSYLARHHEIARAVAPEVSGESVHAAHSDAVSLFERLVERGRSEGAFRDDLPTVWLVNACLGLIHTAAATVHAGQMDSDAARAALETSIVELCVGRGRPRRASE